MRLRPSICALIVGSALAYSVPVGAQEGKSQPDVDATMAPRSEPDPVLSESENRANKLAPTAVAKETVRDSVQIKPVKAFKPEKVTKEEEDPLSFNFLYYIIEKFKMSDIIE